MKIRNGFVSNSSSSSFLIYGTQIDKDPSLFGKDEDEYLPDMLDPLIEKGSGVEIETPPEDGLYIGISWDKIKDDETGKQFKERAEKTVKILLEKAGYTKEIKFSTHEAAWYDG